MVDGILSPCNVACGSGMTCHWICQVTAPFSVACGSGVMTLSLPSGSTLQCDMWLWDEWCRYPMVKKLYCHCIRQVAATCNVGRGSGIISHWVRPNVRHMGILLLVSILTISLQLTITCHSAPVYEILSKLHRPRQRKLMSCRFSRWQISAILEFRVPVMGSLKIPCTTSYRSSVSHMWLLIDAVFNNVE